MKTNQTTTKATKALEIIQNPNTKLLPIDDPLHWEHFPAFDAPSAVDVKYWQKRINDVGGTTRNNEPIFKLVWNGDRTNWREFYMNWDAAGLPLGGAIKRPIVRYKAKRNLHTKQLERDVFPARWLILARLEPEQFPNYKKESWIFAPEIGRMKQIRPDKAPKVYWLWFQTISEHTGYCCVTAEEKGEKCYGKYAPPGFALDNLGALMQAQSEVDKFRNPFADISPDYIRASEEENTGYRAEIKAMEIESEIFLENPEALIGIVGGIKAGINPKRAEALVSDYYKRRKDDLAKLRRAGGRTNLMFGNTENSLPPIANFGGKIPPKLPPPSYQQKKTK